MRKEEREKWEKNEKKKIGNIGHKAHWPDGLVIIYCQCEMLFLFRSYVSLQRRRADDEHEELIRDVSQRMGQPAEKKEWTCHDFHE